MLVSEVIARLDTEVEELSKRVEGAAELSELVKRGELPQVTPAAFVLPLGLRGGEVTASAANVFVQMVEEIVAVVLVTESVGDGTGALALPTIADLGQKIIDALCGFAPDEQIGVFRLQSAQLVSLSAGSVIYQLNFAIQNQVRVTA